MRKALVVASRELRERWLLLAASPVCGCFPLVLPAFGQTRETALLVGIWGAFSLAVAAAIVTGASMLARDGADGRIGFLFTRPLSWLQIWTGKWAAALVLTFGCGVLACLPWMMFLPPQPATHSWRDMFLESARDTGLALPVLAVLLIGGASLLATLYRARSAWLALDAGLLLAALWGSARYVAPITLFGFESGLGPWRPLLVALPLAAALLVASAAQTAIGRTDIRRAHRALSAGFWGMVGALLLVAAGFVAWVEEAGPADLEDVSAVRASADGRWLSVEGRTNRGGHYQAGFLLDTTTGGYVPTTDLDLTDYWFEQTETSTSISADGRFALRADRSDGGTALELLDLTATPPRRSKVQLEKSVPPSWWTSIQLSPSGKEALVVQESSLSLFALPSGRSLVTSSLHPNWHVAAVRFRGQDARAWIVEAHPGRTRSQAPSEVRVIDLSASGQKESRAFTAQAGLQLRGQIVPNATGDRLLTLDGGLRLRDAANGTVLATLAEDEVEGARFVPDGRVVAIEATREHRTLRVFDARGRALQSLDLGGVTQGGGGLFIGPDAGPGRVIVAADLPFLQPRRCLIVDLGSGQVIQTLEGLGPARSRWWADPLFAERHAGTGLFVDQDGRLARVDFTTGKSTVLAGPEASRGQRIARF